MSIGFLNPALLWGLLAAAIPLAIHLFFRRRPRPTPFPAIDFILRARRETQRRLRIRKVLLFTARTLLLAAAALAIARPRAERPGEAAAAVVEGPKATAIVLDASGSMRYRLGGRALFERARADALGALAALGPDEPATAVVCGAETPAAEPPGFDRAAVRRLLEQAEAWAGHADLTACVGAAVRALASPAAQARLGKRVVVATDLAASAWRLDVPPPVIEGPEGKILPEVTVQDAARGAPLPNLAVVGLDAEPDPAAGPRGYRVTAAVSSAGGEARKDVPLGLSAGAGPGAKTAIRAFVDLPSGGTVRKTLSYAFPQGGPAVLQVALPEDALPMDDARAVALVVPREVRALVVDGAPSPVRYRDEAYFVESALASAASPVRPKLVDADAFPGEDLSRYDVVLLLNVRSVGAKAGELERFVENGGGLFLSLGDEVDPEAYDRELGKLLPMPLHVVKTAASPADGAARAARFADVAWDHPALSIFVGEAREGLLGTRTYRYVLAKPGPKGAPATVLASFDDGAPALVEARRGRGRVLLFTSSADRDWTDWPIRTSFLPAMQRFAGFLAGGLEERREPALVVGAQRTIRLEPGERLAGLVDPGGRERGPAELERMGLREGERGGLVITPREPGLWQVKVTAQGKGERLEPRLAFAVSPDPRESDTRRLEPKELTAYFGGETHAKVEGDAQAAGAGRTIPLWSVLLVLALAAFFLEGLLIS
ncbi:BatA domain-containing protein [Anaeromyxobacter soli]|uniref:BatA domain-containing protein n=1 Tax=Anaeromyxobacter soli TaxID=2922725 RepID=UPI001FAFB6F5|nr:BatA domain-containing protein [Anaeromyxobacter sp. SG29]